MISIDSLLNMARMDAINSKYTEDAIRGRKMHEALIGGIMQSINLEVLKYYLMNDERIVQYRGKRKHGIGFTAIIRSDFRNECHHLSSQAISIFKKNIVREIDFLDLVFDKNGLAKLKEIS